MNTNIISEFDKLVSFIQHQINECKKDKLSPDKAKECMAHQFRLKQVSQALTIIKRHPSQITLDNLKEFKQPGIGKGTLDRIKEILEKGKLDELKNFKDISTKDKQILEELESIVGIGKVAAKELFDAGITSVKDLKKKIKSGEIQVNEKILLGVKYFGKFEGNIPRKEITEIHKIIKSIIDKLNKKLDTDKKYIFEICGSYRREKPTSGDIDILISKLDYTSDDKDDVNHLQIFINKLKENLKDNDGEPLLTDDMTEHFETKYMGFAKYKDNPYRRIDIRFIPYDSYYSALLYFTGSAELNKKMRIIAKKEGYKLSEYGLTKDDGTRVPIKSEHDIFEILKIEYLIPRLR
jgi:DNA polymerase/3'-5' exonuclease PolX